MGAPYFAAAIEELEEIPSAVEEEKFIPLVYLRAFLGDRERAEEALECCDRQKEIAECHMQLILGQKEKGMELAERRFQRKERGVSLVNRIEFFVCAEEFARAISLAEQTEPGDRFASLTANGLRLLAQFLQGGEASPQMDDVVLGWQETLSSWSFMELLLMKERCRRDNRDYGNRLDIIEELVRWGAVAPLQSRDASLFTQGWFLASHRLRHSVRRRRSTSQKRS